MILKIKYSNNTSNIPILTSLQGEIKLYYQFIKY